MAPVLPLLGGAYLGWGLGANDAANVFGTAVAARIVPYRQATLFCAASLTLGALFQGQPGIRTLGALTAGMDLTVVAVLAVCAALTVTLMTVAALPVSASQAVVGAIVGVAAATGQAHEHVGMLLKIVLCWLATPVGAAACAAVLYRSLGYLFTRVPMSILTRDKLLWGGLLIVGLYGSYALGANNVANATGIFLEHYPQLDATGLAVLGAVAISIGTLTFSRRVMFAVGAGIMPLDAFTAFVAVTAMSVTVHFFAWVGVPVSTSQGIVGAILGIGFVRGVYTLRRRKLAEIALGWVCTPVLALVLSAAAYALLVGLKLV